MNIDADFFLLTTTEFGMYGIKSSIKFTASVPIMPGVFF